MANVTTPEEIKWGWWILTTISGIFVGVFTAGMYTQRVLSKYVTKEMLDDKCEQCEKQEDRDETSLTRELQNIHSAIAIQGSEIVKLNVLFAELRGKIGG